MRAVTFREFQNNMNFKDEFQQVDPTATELSLIHQAVQRHLWAEF